MNRGVLNVEEKLGELLSGTRPEFLYNAMRYAVMAGGKRIRPQICLASALAAGGEMEDAIFPACAIELLHSYTLIHDDLPSMDNDTMRRGKSSVWAKFGESTAILAGDALQSLAFKTAARAPRNAEQILVALSDAGVGVVCGQFEDISRQQPTTNHQPLTTDHYDFICRHKTADLFVAAATMGAYAAGGSDADVERLRSYALNIGLAFQHEDDLLDGDSPYSVDETRRKIDHHTAAALSALEGLPGDTEFLTSLAQRLAFRKE